MELVYASPTNRRMLQVAKLLWAPERVTGATERTNARRTGRGQGRILLILVCLCTLALRRRCIICFCASRGKSRAVSPFRLLRHLLRCHLNVA